MVERIKITPEKFTVLNASSAVKFDSDNKYVKTGGVGLKAGGYERMPCVYGGTSYELFDWNTISPKWESHGFPIVLPNAGTVSASNNPAVHPPIVVTLPHNTYNVYFRRYIRFLQYDRLYATSENYSIMSNGVAVGTFKWAGHFYMPQGGSNIYTVDVFPLVLNIALDLSASCTFPSPTTAVRDFVLYTHNVSITPPNNLSGLLPSNAIIRIIPGYISVFGKYKDLTLEVTV